MSNQVDNRVVQMKFDNASFEKNVSTSMDTLSKLNKSLTLTEGVKGLSGISEAARRVDLSGINNGVEAVRMKFSALEVMAVTALANITNVALNAGKNVAKALMIDPIKMGFQEYETQINAVQTILANTESKGTTLTNVNNALAELNEYADKTIYNFTEMTRNIGTFTAAGVDLKTSVSAIKGIANLAAVSGSNSQQASTAMYQLSQALASGTVKLMDWNSVVNAGMGGQVFQDALKETARLHGVSIDSMIKEEGSFRETLQNGWLSSEILTETLSKFTGDLNAEQLKSMGYSDDQVKSILKLGQTANDAATKVKTFTQLFDTLKEAAQSGWSQSWGIIVGDFGEAKELLTEMSNTFGGIIGGMADARNKVLLGGLSSGWKQLLSQGVNDSAGYEEEIAKIAKKHGVDLNSMVNDTTTFQDALQESMKSGKLNASTLTEALQSLTDKTAGMSDAQLEELGYTRKQIDELEKFNTSVKSGSVNMQEFADKMGKTSGRENLIEALRNSLNGILSVIKPVSEAFREIFPPMTGEQLYKLTETIRDLTAKFTLSEEASKNLKNTFKGMFAVIDIVGQAFKAVFKEVSPLFGSFVSGSGSILKMTGSFGEWLVKLDETIKKTNFFTKAIDGIKETIGAFLSGFLQDLDKLKEKLNIDFDLPGVEIFSSLLQRVHDRMAEIMHSSETLRNAVNDAFDSMVSSAAFTTFSEGLGKIVTFLQAIWKVIKMVGKGIADSVGEFTSGFAGALGDADFNAAFDLVNGGLLSALLAGIVKFMFGLGKVLDNVGESIGTFAAIKDAVLDTFGAFQQQLKANILLKIAGAIALLTLSLVVLSLIDSEKLASSLAAITGLFADLMISMKIFSDFSLDGMKELTKLAGVMLVMSISVLILAGAMKVLADLDWNGVGKGLVGVGVLMLLLVKTAEELSKINGKMMKGLAGLIILAVTIRILVEAVKDLADMSWEDLSKGLLGVGVLIGELAAFMYAAKFGKMGVSTGLGLIALAVGVRILSESVEVFASMDTTGLIQGLAAIGIVLAELALFMQASGDPKRMVSTSIGLVILGAAMLIFAEAVGKFGELPLETMIQGLAGMAAVLTILSISLNLMPKNMLGIGIGLVVVGAALNIMANALQTIGGMPIENLILALVGLAGALAIISLAMYAMEGGLVGAAAMLVMAAALAIFAPTLVLLSTMSMTEIGKGLLALAGAFVVLGVAGAVLGPLIPAILGLAVAFALIGVGIAATGVGLLAIGVGLSAMAAGFGALATLGAAGAVAVVAALVIIIEGVASMIPIVLQKIGEGIIALAQVLIDSAPVIVEAVVVIILAVVAGLVATIPVLVDGIFVLFTSILNAIVTYAPTIIEALLNILVIVLDGITAALPTIIQSAVNLMMAFIAGIASASVQLVQAAFDAMITFINGLADCIDRNTPLLINAINRLFDAIINAAIMVLTNSVSRMRERGKAIMDGVKSGISDKIEDVKSSVRDIISGAVSAVEEKIEGFKAAGGNIVNGLIKGIKDKFEDARKAASDLGAKILQSAKDALGIKSPSREFAEVGRWSVMGLSKGLQQYASNVYGVAADVATGTVDAMRSSFNGISSVISDNMDLNPVIRPTLDLSNITNGAKSISSMFNNQKLGVNGEVSQNGGSTETPVGSMNFTQNIYSPKAVSRTETYRQTKNLLSTAKGLVNGI